MLARALPRPVWHRQNIALFLRAGGPLYEGTARGRIRFRYFDLFVPLEKQLSALKKFQPSIVVAPPSLLRQLGEAKITPEKVISVAEVLDPMDEIFLEKMFGQPIHQIYQATEGCIASTCHHNTLHLHEDLLHIEKEELGDGHFVPIITDLHRRTQPIIRYRLDDILVKKQGGCRCGSPLLAIERIEGRCDDLLRFPHESAGSTVVVYPDFFRRIMITQPEKIEQYQIAQRSSSLLEIGLKTDTPNKATLHRNITSAIAQLCTAQKATVPLVKFVNWTPPEKGAKLRRVTGEKQIAD